MTKRRLLVTQLIVIVLVGLGSAELLAQVTYQSSDPEKGMAVESFESESEAIKKIASTNPVLWRQYQAVQAGMAPSGGASGGSTCSTCGCSHDRCGCNTELFPWIDGPGNCDSWCVGPKWAVEADGLILFRDDADWDRVIADVGLTPSVEEQFDHGPGARVFVSQYNESGFGIQIGYEGINDWTTKTAFPLTDAERSFNYSSNYNSLEVNFSANVPYEWKFFSGVRYVEIDENFIDSTVNDKPIPAPADPPAAPTAFVDTVDAFLLDNRLIGFQLGARRDTWQLGRWLSLESFANAGVYCNKFRRNDVAGTITTTIYGDDLATPDEDEFSQTTNSSSTTVRSNFTRVAFLGEAGLTGVVRLNQCVALRGGYQVLLVDGVSSGLEAYFDPGFNSTTMVFHGMQFGLEYRR